MYTCEKCGKKYDETEAGWAAYLCYKGRADIYGVCGGRLEETMGAAYPQYFKDVDGVASIDVYQTHALFGIDDPSGCLHHASKKLLLSGVRTGGKSKHQDIKEARDTLNRWLEINCED